MVVTMHPIVGMLLIERTEDVVPTDIGIDPFIVHFYE